jgi:hypothetical protein
MTWVVWRQQRLQILITLGLVLVIAAALVYVRADALTLLPDRAAVSDKYNQFMEYFVLVMLALPALLGMFTGAPLFAREIEQGTHVFGLTQLVSRRRWLVTKVAVAGGSLVLPMLLLGLVAAWALEPLSFVNRGQMAQTMFETQGLTVGAYSLAAFAIGATAGLVLRNTLAAMVLTLVVYGALVMGVANGVRPGYAEPSRFQGPYGVAMSLEPRGSWTVDSGYLDAAGNEVPLSPLDCSRGPEPMAVCMTGKGVVARYNDAHLPERFWQFQLTEFALFLTLSGAVFTVGLWASRRRLT